MAGTWSSAFRLTILWSLCVLIVRCQEDGPIRNTTYGRVRGTYRTDKYDSEYEDYRSIPFAGPPVGEMRWEKPFPPEPWEDVRDATEYGPHCVQFVAVGYPVFGMTNETSEDCLTLDVYVPDRDRVGENLAVMVWIFGGAFVLGTSQMYPGYDIALRGDVVVVAINYRFGSIGFLSTEDEVAPGNYGLWDVALALEWVRDNVANFGGDPSKITVFGQSAGGVLTSHMMISSHTNDLFHRGLSASGASSGFFGTAQPGAIAQSTQTLARTLGCRRLNSSSELIQCMRELDARDLDFWGIVSIVVFRQQLPNFMPRIDGDFVPVDPAETWRSGAATHLDFLTGSTMHDSAFVILLSPLAFSANNTRNLAGSPEQLNDTLTFFTNQYPGDTEEMISAMYNMYPLMPDEDDEVRTEATILGTTDWWFSEPAHYEAEHHARLSESTNTYLYLYRHDHSFLSYSFDFVQGSHFDDIYSILGEPFMEIYREDILGQEFSEEDHLVNDNEANYFVNFANTGDPNIGIPVPTQWPQYDNASLNYIEISTNPGVFTETEEDLQYYRFWREEFPLIRNPPDETELIKISNVEDYSDEEFNAVLEYGVTIIRDYMAELFSEYPEQVEAFYEFIEEAVERREQRMEDIQY